MLMYALGEVNVLSVYIVYDTGKSANPIIDLGQVEGGIVYGLGNVLTEEVIYNSEGILHTDSTWTYKIPGYYNNILFSHSLTLN